MKITETFYTATVLALTLFTANALAVESIQPPDHMYDFRWSLPTEPDRALSSDQAAQVLREFDVVFFGELHTHPGIHLAQMEILARMHQQNPALTLSLEQFERDTQPLIDQYLAGEIGEDHLIVKARAWENYRPTYRALIEFARAHDLPVLAANAPKQMVVCVGRSGLEILQLYPPDQRAHVASEVDTADGRYRRKFLSFMQHDAAHKAPEGSENARIMQTMALRGFAAQALRDDTMAETIALHLKANPGRRVLHLNGNFHSSGFLGAVERLQQRLPDLKIAVIDARTTDEAVATDPDSPNGTLTISVLPIPDRFVQPENREQWLQRVMEKRMEGRDKCPD
jgi:uncharacterized iron-regulated protein